MRALLVDGYNIIHAHPRLSQVVGEDQEAAREGLLREVAPLASPAFYGMVVVVFDAAGSRNPEPVSEERGGMTVVFTRRGQTADSFIEAAVKRLAAAHEVEVATSDRVLSGVSSGFGARVMGGEALLALAREALSETREELKRLRGRKRPPLEERVSEEIRRLLDQMRY